MKYQSYFLLGLPLIILGVWAFSQFDGLYGQDPYAYYTYATGPLADAMPGWPPPFSWPPGYPLLIWLVSLVMGETPVAGQLISLVSGVLVVVFTTLLANDLRLGDSSLGVRHSTFSIPLVAGLLVAFTGQLWQSSVVVMTDVPGLATATIGVWALVHYGRTRRLFGLGVATFAIAYAVLTRWALALIAVLALIYVLFLLRSQPRKTAVFHILVAGFVALVVLTPVLGSVWEFLTAATPQEHNFVVDLQVVTWNPLNAFKNSFVNSDGFLQYRLPNGLYYAWVPVHRYYFTPLLGVFVLPGLWACWQNRKNHALILVAGWAALVLLFLMGIRWQNFRFTLAYLPPVAILAATGFVTIWEKFPERFRWIPPLYLAVGLFVMGWGGWQLTHRFIERKEADLTAVDWVEARTPANARILSLNMTPALKQYSQREAIEYYYLTPTDLETLLADDTPSYLFIEVANVEDQWRDLSPGINYRWLVENPGLTEIGQERTYTLFQIGEE